MGGQGWPPQPPAGPQPPGYGAGGYPAAGPPPSYPPAPGHPPPGYAPPGYPPPGYPPPGYGYGPPPAPPPGYPAPDIKPGVVPLRPLSLGDIYNGAVGYIRANPKATLGLTAIVVIISQAVALLLQLGSLSTLGNTTLSDTDYSGFTGYNWAEVVASLLTGLATLVLTGMLTVVVGRAVFGAPITVGEAWQRIRDRILPLLGYIVLVGAGAVGIFAVLTLLVVVAGSANIAAGILVALLVGLPVLIGLLWLAVNLIFAPVAIVLERQSVFAAMSRSFALVRGDFWRVLGIWLLTSIVTFIISMALALPFGIVGGIIGAVQSESTSAAMIAVAIISIGAVFGQIVTTPFSAGVTALLYTDRRIRAEAFDLVLRTGATGYPASTDQLWLVRH